MAIQVAAAAIPAVLMKALAALKGVKIAGMVGKGAALAAKGGKAATTAAMAAKATKAGKAASTAASMLGKGSTSLAAKGAKAGTDVSNFLINKGVPKNISRFAGDRIAALTRSVTPKGFAQNLGGALSKDELVATFAPDIALGLGFGAFTEGDIVDKLTSGVTSSIGGAGGGLLTRGVLGPKSQMGRVLAELGGGLAGDMVGYNIGDSIIRAKHGGLTPAEKRMLEEEQRYQAAVTEAAYDDVISQLRLT